MTCPVNESISVAHCPFAVPAPHWPVEFDFFERVVVAVGVEEEHSVLVEVPVAVPAPAVDSLLADYIEQRLLPMRWVD